MVSACVFSVLLELPSSPVRALFPQAELRRALLGVGMGGTATAIAYSPWGKRSGAHINPAVTLTFYRLGKIRGWNAVGYVFAQFVGATLGVGACVLCMSSALIDRRVDYVATVPGPAGVWVALATEAGISFLLMSVVLRMGDMRRVAPYAGLVTGLLVALYVFSAAPVSGFGMNPARSFGSAIFAQKWSAWWVYAFAPPLAMLLAAELHVRLSQDGGA